MGKRSRWADLFAKNKTGRDSVPVLGNIPWLGQLFRHDGKDNERRELVVFITPRLVSIQ